MGVSLTTPENLEIREKPNRTKHFTIHKHCRTPGCVPWGYPVLSWGCPGDTLGIDADLLLGRFRVDLVGDMSRQASKFLSVVGEGLFIQRLCPAVRNKKRFHST